MSITIKYDMQEYMYWHVILYRKSCTSMNNESYWPIDWKSWEKVIEW